MSPSLKALAHGFKVAATIAGSMLFTGATIYFSNPENLVKFGQYFEHYGVPVAIVNIVVAAIMKYISEHNKQASVDSVDVSDDITDVQQ